MGKITISAEIAAYLKFKGAEDPFGAVFASPLIRLFCSVMLLILPPKIRDQLIDRRIAVYVAITSEINKSNSTCVIDLGAGYSTRGMLKCRKQPEIAYIDIDLPEVIRKKREVLRSICASEGKRMPTNYHLISHDFHLADQLSFFANIHCDTGLIVAEAVLPYLSKNEVDRLLIAIQMIRANKIEFLSHELFGTDHFVSGKWGSIFRVIMRFLTGVRSHTRFSSPQDARAQLITLGFKEVTLKKHGFFFTYCAKTA
jgi:hypothetical protein